MVIFKPKWVDLAYFRKSGQIWAYFRKIGASCMKPKKNLMFSFLSLLPLIQAATIADLVQQSSDLKTAAGLIPTNPLWASSGQFTLIVATDQAIQGKKNELPTGIGKIFANRSISNEAHYEIVADVDGTNRCVLDNYEPGGQDATKVHILFGMGMTLANRRVQADNGWLYVLDDPIIPPKLISVTAPTKQAVAFWKVISDAGLAEFVDGLQGITIFLPSDTAVDQAKQKLAKLTANKLKSVVLFHIMKAVMYTTNVGNTDSTTYLKNTSLTFTAENEQTSIAGQAKIGGSDITQTADIMVSNGVMHIIDAVLFPDPIPDEEFGPAIPRNATSNTTNSAPVASISPKPSDNSGNTLVAYLSIALISAFISVAFSQ